MKALKDEARILGIDDAAFDKFKDRYALVVGVLFRGGKFMDGVITTRVAVDGINSTQKLAEMINKTKFRPQIQCIMLDGIAMGGFNVIDIVKLHDKTGIPVLVFMRDHPDLPNIERILKKIGMEQKIALLRKGGKIVKMGNIHIQFSGMAEERARDFLRISIRRGNIPEPLRVAHLIGQGIMLGESRGKA